ncbi:MAG: PEP-CTERM sorting domain-containing protein [Candidatus Omnitrophica bacterium]|nr:PEP-CTERM sorting domain-containing protein [Candidatus Omnitrophota bacterium]
MKKIQLILTIFIFGVMIVPAYAGLIFFQDFDSETPGAFPASWEKRSINSTPVWDDIFFIAEDPLRSGNSAKYIDATRFNGYAPYREFDPQYAQLIVEFDMMQLSGDDDLSFYAEDGNLNGANVYFSTTKIEAITGYSTRVNVAPLTLNEWYHIKFDIDIPSNTYDIYVNGTKAIEDVGFRIGLGFTEAESIKQVAMGGAGTPTYSGYIDNVSVSSTGDVVPEPATMFLLLTGLFGFSFLRKTSR